jgi:L-lysine exporter family protein LysE/ArgO
MTLIALGVGGMGSLVTRMPALAAAASWGGAAFLLLYGARSFRSALAPGALSTAGAADPPALGATLLAALGFSLLNPHVYLDTVVLIGSVGARFPPDQRAGFAAGAMLASTVWFFGLAYGAAQLAPLFRRPAAWRVLDVAVGATMWAIAVSLVRDTLR